MILVLLKIIKEGISFLISKLFFKSIPFINSFVVIFKILHISLYKDKSGKFLPFSQFDTVLSVTPNMLANSL